MPLPSDPSSGHDLARRLAHPDPQVRMAAAREVGRVGPPARHTTPVLVSALDDPDPMVRAMVAAALGKVGASAAEALPGLLRLLQDPVPPVRFWACEAIGRLEGRRDSALPALEALGMGEEKAVQGAARLARQRICASRDAQPPPGRGEG